MGHLNRGVHDLAGVGAALEKLKIASDDDESEAFRELTLECDES